MLEGPSMKRFLKILAFVCTASMSQQGTAKPVLNEWFALGSGCRAKADLPGNVKMEPLPQDPNRPNSYRVKFTFLDFQLKSDTADTKTMQFAKECAVRIAINPPSGKRISEVKATTSIVASKGTGATLDISSELKIGSTSLGTVRKTLASSAKSEPVDERIELASGSSKDTSLPELSCGEGKVIGFDYSWIVKREHGQSSQLHVELSRDKSLILEASLDSCS